MRKTTFTQDEYYHLYNRGVDKRITFSSAVEYERFLMYLYILNSEDHIRFDNISRSENFLKILFLTPRPKPLVAIHAYCLMPNHFHLLVSEKTEGGISTFMQKLSTAYTMYFNSKHKRSGSLFQGPFKAVQVENDTQFKYLFSYIHANPFSTIQKDGSVQINDIEKVLQYPYSSITEYTGKTRNSSTLLDVLPFIQKELQTITDAKKHIKKWLDFHSS